MDGKEQEGKQPARNLETAIAAKLSQKAFLFVCVFVFGFVFPSCFNLKVLLFMIFLLSFLTLCSLTRLGGVPFWHRLSGPYGFCIKASHLLQGAEQAPF